MSEVAGKLDLIQSKLLCRIDENSEKLKRNKDQIDRYTDQIDPNRIETERLHTRLSTKPNEQEENYSRFAEKKSKNLFIPKK